LYGLFLKVFLADNLSPLVDEAFSSNPSTLSAIDVWMMAFLFGFQIYFDFSAYSHIALGSAKLMGINIPENFNFPYMASSFKDFWKRWHISLSSWIRDYLYLPLAGIKVTNTTGTGGIGEGLDKTNNQGSKTRALFLTWAIMGFWHGANWTFIFWGVYHAVIIFLERKLHFLRLNFRFLDFKFVGWSFTLLLVMLSWIPFRAKSLEDSFMMYSKLFSPHNYTFYTMRENNYLITFIVLIMIILAYFFNNFINPILERYKELSFVFHTVKYTILIIIVFTFLRPISQFIYFQF
jgi:D-alanyl-lipoteichoic acid acyltransferase DltB (MBOAT superfamily)